MVLLTVPGESFEVFLENRFRDLRDELLKEHERLLSEGDSKPDKDSTADRSPLERLLQSIVSSGGSTWTCLLCDRANGAGEPACVTCGRSFGFVPKASASDRESVRTGRTVKFALPDTESLDGTDWQKGQSESPAATLSSFFAHYQSPLNWKDDDDDDDDQTVGPTDSAQSAMITPGGRGIRGLLVRACGQRIRGRTRIQTLNTTARRIRKPAVLEMAAFDNVRSFADNKRESTPSERHSISEYRDELESYWIVRGAKLGGYVRTGAVSHFVFLTNILAWLFILGTARFTPMEDMGHDPEVIQSFERVKGFFDAGFMVDSVSAIAMILACYSYKRGLLTMMHLLDVTPSVGETLMVSVLGVGSFSLVLRSAMMGFAPPVFVLWAFMDTFYWCALALARACTRNIQLLLWDMNVLILEGSDVNIVQQRYSTFHLELLNIYPMFNVVMVPFLLMSIFKLSLWAVGLIHFKECSAGLCGGLMRNLALILVREMIILIWVAWPAIRTASIHRQLEMAALGRASKNKGSTSVLISTLAVGRYHGGFKLGTSQVITFGFILQCASYVSLLFALLEQLVGSTMWSSLR